MINLFGEDSNEKYEEIGFFTGRYSALRRYGNAYKVSISVGTPEWANVHESIEILKPYGLLGEALSAEEYEARYIQKLEKLGVKRIQERLDILPKNKAVILLCHEDITKAQCHRRIFADWWKSKTGQEIKEYEHYSSYCKSD